MVKARKILVIEDNQDIRENIAEILELSDYKFFTAVDGKDGLAKAQDIVPDLIICDIMMPVLDGYGVLHNLQKNTSLQNIPFIFLTAKSERTDWRKGMELGADDFITKPFTEIELLSAIESRIRKVEQLNLKYTNNQEGYTEFIESAKGLKELENLTQGKNTRTLKKKQIIYNEGDTPSKLFYLSKGSIKTYKTNADGKEFITNIFKPGDFIGYISILEESIYKETAELIEDCELISITKEEFHNILFKNREVVLKFIQLLANDVSDKEEQLLRLAYNSLRKRVADSLLDIAAKIGTIEENNVSFNMSREEMAEIVGTATESLIRTLSDLKSEKLIESKGSKITILNKTALKNLRG
jgi:CRP-like cAMP-binding protein/CheY-like chemotaxis protein